MGKKAKKVEIPKNPLPNEIGEIIIEMGIDWAYDYNWEEWAYSKRVEELRLKSADELKRLYRETSDKISQIKKSEAFEIGGGLAFKMCINELSRLRKHLLRIIFLLIEREEEFLPDLDVLDLN